MVVMATSAVTWVVNAASTVICIPALIWLPNTALPDDIANSIFFGILN